MITTAIDFIWEFVSNPPVFYTLLGFLLGTLVVLFKVWLEDEA